MVGWFDVVCIQRKHEDTKLIKSHGSYQQASMRFCLFGEDQELSYEGLPWSTMAYHGLPWSTISKVFVRMTETCEKSAKRWVLRMHLGSD